MKKNVYPSKEIQPYHNKFVWAYLDTDKPQNRKDAIRYKVSGIPHLIFENTRGEIVDQLTGGTSPKNFAQILDKVLAKK